MFVNRPHTGLSESAVFPTPWCAPLTPALPCCVKMGSMARQAAGRFRRRLLRIGSVLKKRGGVAAAVSGAATAAALLAFVAPLGRAAGQQEEPGGTENPRHLVALADELVRVDRLPEAEDALRRALLEMPDAIPIAVNRASLLFRLSRYAEAEVVLRGVLDRSPDHPFAHYLLGAIALRAGEPGGADADAAARHAEAALAGFPDDYAAGLSRRAEALYLLGEARLALGDQTAGEAAIRASLDIAAFQPGPRYLLGRHLIRAGRVVEGTQELEVFAKAKAASEAVTLAVSLFHDGNRPRIAEASLRRALILWPDHPPALHALAELLASTGRNAEAEAIRGRLSRTR